MSGGGWRWWWKGRDSDLRVLGGSCGDQEKGEEEQDHDEPAAPEDVTAREFEDAFAPLEEHFRELCVRRDAAGLWTFLSDLAETLLDASEQGRPRSEPHRVAARRQPSSRSADKNSAHLARLYKLHRPRES